MTYDRGQAWLQGTEHPWFWFAKQTMVFWALLMMPLFITLQTALVANLDHGARAWKHLFAQPVSRAAIYTAKLITSTALIGLSLLGLVFFTAVAGSLLGWLRPDFKFGVEVPWIPLLQMAGLIFVTSWFMVALHNWVALRWANFVVPSALGITMTVIAMVVCNSDFWVQFYPWTVPALLMMQFGDGLAFPWTSFWIGLGGGWVVALVGGWLFVQREVL
jgi:hypothetical protein